MDKNLKFDSESLDLDQIILDNNCNNLLCLNLLKPFFMIRNNQEIVI